jgi:hypothetical protein
VVDSGADFGAMEQPPEEAAIAAPTPAAPEAEPAAEQA